MEFNVLFSLLALVSGLPLATGSPLSDGAVTVSTPSAADQASPPPRRLIRSKRCSCSSFLDKECIYFCHLDIIWINTPEQIVPYGLGSSRARRSAKNNLAAMITSRARCECRSQADSVCQQFCEDGQQAARFQVKTPIQKQYLEAKSDRTVQNKQDFSHQGLKCVYQHLLNITKQLKPVSSKHLPTSMKWINRIGKARQEDHNKLKSLPLSMGGSVTHCRDCKR
ncbi:endothelin-1 [Pristis pectinata]|uniref:endothelin-1 n=1 Tax=Pristis pectinata TaxID=685728 RepID=UPI00223D0A5E|nr:endothelin-1 [Pristis pectinata]